MHVFDPANKCYVLLFARILINVCVNNIHQYIVDNAGPQIGEACAEVRIILVVRLLLVR